MASRSSTVDHYKELGLNRHATSNDIRTAYKRLALIWHPDRNKAKDAEEKFKKIKQAHDILIDENQKKEYDQQHQNTWFPTTNTKHTQPNQESFHLHTFDNLMSSPIDPFDILNDIQFFQDSDFTSKMMNSPSYRNLYTHIFNSMNSNNPTNNHQMYSSSPIYLNNDRLFRPISKPRSKPHSSSSKHSTVYPIPVIHSTMPNDWFLNELIDLHEQQNQFNKDPFFNDLTHCTKCHKKISNDRTRLIQHEQQCRQTNKQYSTIPTKSVRV